ncbi:Crp/Fnr family transcriptional regulator [bacterium]|nr:Crp/Fnr family transcriptional regulator [candidate division CSSED10-310 bacterium]
MMEPATFLKQTELFGSLSEAALRALRPACIMQFLAKNEHLFVEGERGAAAFILAKGAVRLYKSTGNGQEVTVRLIKPGELFAEVILFENDSYPVGAVAIKPGAAVRISRHTFRAGLANEELRDQFIRQLMRKQRFLADRILYLTHLDVEERFFGFLRQHYGERQRYTVTLSKKDIAAAIGTVPETLSRLVNRLQGRNLLRWKGVVIELADGFWERDGYSRNGNDSRA